MWEWSTPPARPDRPPLAFDGSKSISIFLYVSTYALSSTVLPVVQEARAPVVVLNLQPAAQLDYEAFNRLGDRAVMTGVWLEHSQSCSAPEIACVFNRARIPYHLVTGYLQDEDVWKEIADWVDAARTAAGMRRNRVGVLGHYYCGMLDVYSDLTQQSAVFGNHFELLEMCELHALREAVQEEQVGEKLSQFHREFDVASECERSELVRAARTSCAWTPWSANTAWAPWPTTTKAKRTLPTARLSPA